MCLIEVTGFLNGGEWNEEAGKSRESEAKQRMNKPFDFPFAMLGIAEKGIRGGNDCRKFKNGKRAVERAGK